MGSSGGALSQCRWTGLHPLFIDHVLQEVLQHLEDHQIASARLVCRQWNFIATDLIRSRVTLTFSSVSNFNKFIELSSTYTSSNTTVVDCSVNVVPYAKFKLGPELFQEDNKESLKRFLKIFGSKIVSLHAIQDSTSDCIYGESERELFSSLNKVKNLNYIDKRLEVDYDLVVLTSVLNSSCENLQSLSISFPRSNSQPPSSFTFPRMKNVKFLKLDMKITDDILNTVIKSGIKLRRLNLSLRASSFSQETLKNVLLSQKGTLQELKFTNLYRRAEINVEIPHLNELVLLEIHGCEIPAYNISFPNFSYKNIPCIRKLFLNTWATTTEWDKFLPQVPNESVKHLSLSMNFDEAPLMQRVSKVFPRLNKLEMYFCRTTVDALIVVFGEMLTLKELTLYQSFLGEVYDTNMDDVLTGLTSQECQWILKNEAYHTVDLPSMRTKPGLDNLSKLEKLDMSSLQYRNIITDVTGYLIFLKMDNLKNLFIGCTQIGELCLEELIRKFSANILVGRSGKQNLDYSIIQEICNCVIM